MTNREKYYSDLKYSSMSIDELADYINIHADLTGPCDDQHGCLFPDSRCLQCCREWLNEHTDI